MRIFAAVPVFGLFVLSVPMGAAPSHASGSAGDVDGRLAPLAAEDPGLEPPNSDARGAGNSTSGPYLYDVAEDNAAAGEYDDGYDPQAASLFTETLAPYGSWIDDSMYGRIWVPSPTVVGLDFAPYATGGQWMLTEYGWTWVSAWDWGWAPFHYGRWVAGRGRGWCWVPGRNWGPGWVSWREGGGYVGWAPLPPRGISIAAPVVRGSPWRFAVARELGSPRAQYGIVRGIFPRMSVVSNRRTLFSDGGHLVVNAGPTALGSLGGRSAPRPLALAEVAPHALPPFEIRPRSASPSSVATRADVGQQHAARGYLAAPAVRPARSIGGGRRGAAGPGQVWSLGTSGYVRASTAPRGSELQPYRRPPAGRYDPPLRFARPMAGLSPSRSYSVPAVRSSLGMRPSQPVGSIGQAASVSSPAAGYRPVSPGYSPNAAPMSRGWAPAGRGLVPGNVRPLPPAFPVRTGSQFRAPLGAHRR